MVDPDVVRRRLRQIDRRVAALRVVANGNRDTFLAASELQAQTERHLQVAIQAAIDIALHVLAEDTTETPEDYGAAFVLLAQHDVIPAALAQQLRLAAGLRNLLVHGYADVDPQRIWAHLDDLDDLVTFAQNVHAYLDQGGA